MKPYPSYKKSEIDWIDTLPSEWDTRRSKYLFVIKKEISGSLDYDVLSVTQQGVKIKDITSGEGQLSTDYSKYQIVSVDDFVMNHMDLLTGYVDISKYDGVTSPDYRVFFLKDQNCLDTYYLYLFQMGYKNKIFFGYGQGSSQLGRWRLPSRQFNNLRFPKPSFNEQNQIVSFLNVKTSKVDLLIKITQKKIEHLKEKRISLINHYVTKGLKSNVQLRDSGVEWIGKIPNHWKTKKLKYTSFVIPSNVDKHVYSDEEPVKLCNYTDVYYNEYLSDNLSFSKGSCTILELEKYILHSGDIVLTKDSESPDDIGVPCYLPSNIQNLVCGYHLTMIRPLNIHGEYLFRFVQSDRTRRYFEVNSSGVTRFGLGKPTIENLLLPIPPEDEQKEISNHIRNQTQIIDDSIRLESSRIDLLKEYRQSLISEVVTGKIDVREWKE